MDEAGRGVLTLDRGEWEALVLQHLAAHTDRLVARDDFALACRCPAPRPALQAGTIIVLSNVLGSAGARSLQDFWLPICCSARQVWRLCLDSCM